METGSPRRKAGRGTDFLRLGAIDMLDFFKRQTEFLFSGYFAVVMATGALSISAHLLGFRKTALFLLGINIITYTLLWILTGFRLVFHPGRFFKDLGNHASGAGFFTLVAGTGVFGSELVIIAGGTAVSAWLYGLASVLWVLIMYAFFTAVIIREDKPGLAAGINGSWLIAAVATQSLSVLGVLLAGEGAGARLLMFASLCLFLLGFGLYVLVIIPIFRRLVFMEFGPRDFAPTYWINMGAVAITALAGSLLITDGEHDDLIVGVLPFLKGLTLLSWVTATWWIPILVLLTIWRYAVRKDPLTYDPQFWGTAFPLAMYTAATHQLAGAFGIPALRIIPDVFFPFSLAVWIVFFLWMNRHLLRVLIKDTGRRR